MSSRTGAIRSSVRILGGLDPVQVWHLDVHDDEVGLQLTSEIDGADTIPRLSNHQVSQIGQHLAKVHANDRLIVGDDHSCLCQLSLSLPGLAPLPGRVAASNSGIWAIVPTLYQMI